MCKGILGITTQLADVYLQVKINGDMALFKAIEKLLYEAEVKEPGKVFDQDFIKENTPWLCRVSASPWKSITVEELAEKCGVPLDANQRSRRIMLKYKSRIIICWAMGITQHENGVDTIKEIVNFIYA